MSLFLSDPNAIRPQENHPRALVSGSLLERVAPRGIRCHFQAQPAQC
ncbi:MAG: hypothetical protein R3D59_09245 [Paracoccaceae bacterium]